MWIAFLVGAVVGASFVFGIILEGYEVHKKGTWEEYWLETRTRVQTLSAENASLRVALAAGEMTEEGKKGALLTMAAPDAVNSAGNEASQESKPSSKNSQ